MTRLDIVRSLCALCLLSATAALRADEGDLKSVLERRLLDPQIPLAEVQDFTESRVPPMPEVTSVEEWEQHAERMRRETLERVVFRGKAAEWRDAETKVEWLDTIDGGPGYCIRKLRYEAVPGLWIPALLYEPEKLEGSVPVVMNVNGHDGKGKAADYKQIRCINQAKRGMLALNVEWLGMGQLATPGLTHYRMNQLDLCGTSGLAPFYLAMSRGLDVLLAHQHADPERVAVAGLSGGGWQTIFISALDTRVTLSNPVAGYSSFRTRARFTTDLGDSEQTPVDLATTADYAQLTAMRAPRPTLLTYNAADNCCFRADHALPPLLDAAAPIYKLYAKEENLRSHVNTDPGNHNFGLDNRQHLYRMLGDHFFPGASDFPRDEIPSDDEVKAAEQLQVEMPADGADFNALAKLLATDLPRNVIKPTGADSARQWQADARTRLRETLRAEPLDVRAIAVAEGDHKDGRWTGWLLRMGGTWTVPAMEIAPGESQALAIVVCDEGRTGAVATVQQLLDAKHRVVVIDPFYLGESKIEKRDFLYALLVSAVGQRPLGIQAEQLAAAARWACREHGVECAKVVGVGPRTSVIALAAAGLETTAIGQLELHGALGSLKELIDQNQPVTYAPELFCFGLLEQLDISQLTALAPPRTVRFAAPSERVRSELAEAKLWYKALGSDFDPLQD